MITKQLVQQLAQERMDELNRGLFIVEISITPSFIINLEIDKIEGYVAIEDCVSVSRNVEHNLDREDQDFELHVSSAGLDKPLRVLAQYTKNIGKEITIKLQDGTKKEGKLLEVSNEQVHIETTQVEKMEGKKKKETIVRKEILAMSDIKETKIVISFK